MVSNEEVVEALTALKKRLDDLEAKHNKLGREYNAMLHALRRWQLASFNRMAEAGMFTKEVSSFRKEG